MLWQISLLPLRSLTGTLFCTPVFDILVLRLMDRLWRISPFECLIFLGAVFATVFDSIATGIYIL